MQFDVRKNDLILINGAIDFGDILKTMPEATASDIVNIEKIQNLLRNLSDVPPNIDADYGFCIYSDEPNFVGANRGWGVSIDTQRNNLITIYSYYNDVPNRDEDLEMLKEYQFQFWEKDLNYYKYSQKYYLEWIKEVSDPNQYRNPEQSFEVETYFKTIIIDGVYN
jgi:hypothetical protein